MGFGPMPDGQYVRAGEGAVRLLPETLRGLPRGPLGWVDTRLFSIPPAEIDTLSVFPADGTNYVLKVKGFSEFELLGASTNQTLDATNAGALARAFQYMSFSGIETGPTDFTAEVRIEIAGKDGTRVEVELGPGDLLRYAATHTPPAEATEDSNDDVEAARQQVEALAARGRWTYRISPQSAAALRHARADLIQRETP